MSRNFRISALYICSTIVWCSVCAVSALAQTIIQTPQQADSLRRVIASQAHDTTKINAMNELAEYFWRIKTNLDSSMAYASESHRMSKILSYNQGIAFALRNIGNIYRVRGQYPLALENLLQSLQVYEKIGDRYGIANVSIGIGLVYRNQGKYGEALEYLFSALRMSELIEDKTRIAPALYGIAFIYSYQKKYSEALDYHFRALKIYEEIRDKRGMANVSNAIGLLYSSQGKNEEALVYLNKALQLGKDLGNEQTIASSLNHIGDVYTQKGNYEQALQSQLQALSINERLGNKPGIAVELNSIARIYYMMSKHSIAIKYSLLALNLADSLGQRDDKRDALEKLATIYQEIKQPQKALSYYQQFVAMKDSIVDVQYMNKMAALKEGYETNKREQQIALQQSELERRNVIQWSLVGTLGVVAIAAVLLGGLYRQKLRANKKILKQQQTLEEQAHTIEEANRELNAANTELQTTNQELDAANRMKTQLLSMAAHDLKNPLGVIIGYADIALMDLPEEAPTSSLLRTMQATADRMNKLIKDLLDSAAMEMGNISLERSEVMLPSLVHAVASRYSYNAEKKEQHIVVEANDHFTVSADADRIEQVLDNLISNAVKYSPTGKTIWVRAMQRGGVARVEVQDEGPGMSDADRAKLFGFFQRLSAQPTGGESSNGVGLAIVKKIVDLHKGKIWAESELGKGTTFVVELPLAGIASERCEE
ncbi:MAG: tetratricopeptide repeat protein [Candidatus Kapaibacteriota bacterium]